MMLRGEMNEMDAEMDAVNCFHLFSDGFIRSFSILSMKIFMLFCSVVCV